MARFFSFNTELWDPSHRFQTSWLVSPYVLASIRLLIVSGSPLSLIQIIQIHRSVIRPGGLSVLVLLRHLDIAGILLIFGDRSYMRRERHIA